jgi:D-aspartate ligase
MVRHSRWFRPAPGPHAPEIGHDSLAAYLDALPLPRAVLMPCSDEWSREVAGLDGKWSERFPASLSSPDTQDALVDKARFAHLLKETGTPHPRTLVLAGPDGSDDLESIDDAFLERAFLKPRDSQAFFRRFGIKAVRPGTPDELRTRLAELVRLGMPMIVQEYVPGPATHHYFVDGFVDRNGRVRARLVRQRLRMYPSDFGNSSYMRTVPVEAAAPAVEAIESLLRGLGFRGIYSAEFKQDARDGVFRLLEVNARPWWYLEFAARSGVDVAWMAYRDALGEPVTDQLEYEIGRTLAFPRYDLFACREGIRAGDASVLGCMRAWATSDRPIFVWDDPLPALHEGLGNSGRWLARRLPGRRLRSRS